MIFLNGSGLSSFLSSLSDSVESPKLSLINSSNASEALSMSNCPSSSTNSSKTFFNIFRCHISYLFHNFLYILVKFHRNKHILLDT